MGGRGFRRVEVEEKVGPEKGQACSVENALSA